MQGPRPSEQGSRNAPRRAHLQGSRAGLGAFALGLAECLRLVQKDDVGAKGVAQRMQFVSLDVERNLDVARQLLHDADAAGSAYGSLGLA